MEQHNREMETFLKEVSMLRAQLIDAKTLSHLAPIVQWLSVQGHIPDPFLPQTVQEVPMEYKRPSTPRPPLHTTNPDPPSAPSAPARPSNPVPSSTPSSVLYVPHTPTSEPISSVAAFCPSTPSPEPIPRAMDYTAGASCGPHHQPTPFEDDQHCDWPVLPLSKEERPPNKAKGKPQGHQCIYCGERGHWNLQCPYPHDKCHEEKKCVVPLRHQYFRQACHYGGRMKDNHPDPTTQDSHKCKRNTTAADFAPPQTPLPLHPTTPDLLATGYPQLIAYILFSPNPPQSRLDPLAQSFLPSRYQGQAPPPGTWRKRPLGEPVGKKPPNGPLLACIFEYGEGRIRAPLPGKPGS